MATVGITTEQNIPVTDFRRCEESDFGCDGEQRSKVVIISPPPIREPWKTDGDGKLISLPWILWLQQLASFGQAEELFSNSLTLVSTAEASTRADSLVNQDDIAALSMMIPTQDSTTKPPNDVDVLSIMSYTPSSSSVLSDDAAMLTWLSF